VTSEPAAASLRKPEIVTFGCRLNAYESEAMAHLAAAADAGDVIVVNTCAVTAEAERQARQAIRRLKREHPTARIVVTGCAAQIGPARFAAMPEVAHVIGNAEKMRADTWQALGDPAADRVRVADIMGVREMAPHLLPGFAEHTRVFLEVQQGCDHRCTFCVIPYGRGPSRSAALGTVVEQIGHYVRGGAREVVLTGVDLTSWGSDLPGRPGFASLVRRILAAVPELPRLRLSSLDPAEVDGALLTLFAEEPRLMPHLHLSIQAGDDLTLKRMKRRHTREQVVTVCRQARAARPEIAIGADLIAGFPTEDDAMFARTLALIDDAGLDLVHAFPFSARAGTPAARMPAVDGAVIRARASQLRDVARQAQTRFLARQVGRRALVLVEKSRRHGHAEDFAVVALNQPATPGTIVETLVVGIDGDQLYGSPVAAAAA